MKEPSNKEDMGKAAVKEDSLIDVSLLLVLLVGVIMEDTVWRTLFLASMVIITWLIINDDFRTRLKEEFDNGLASGFAKGVACSFGKSVDSVIDFLIHFSSRTDRK
jgi:hypothetical protein